MNHLDILTTMTTDYNKIKSVINTSFNYDEHKDIYSDTYNPISCFNSSIINMCKTFGNKLDYLISDYKRYCYIRVFTHPWEVFKIIKSYNTIINYAKIYMDTLNNMLGVIKKSLQSIVDSPIEDDPYTEPPKIHGFQR